MKLGKIGQEIYEMKSSLYYFPYWFPGIITQINSRQEINGRPRRLKLQLGD
jgi:hypothetical protein